MKKQYIIIGIIIALIVAAFGYWYTSGPMNQKTLTTHNWDVLGNGMYNHITFDDSGTFAVYAYPQEVDAGEWTYQDGVLTLDFASDAESRMYKNMKFNRSGKMTGFTDGNIETWIVKE